MRDSDCSIAVLKGPEARRRATVAWASSKGFEVPSGLPLLDERPPAKSVDRAAHRALCLYASFAVTRGWSRVHVLGWLRGHGLQADVTDRELDYILHGPDLPDDFARGCAEADGALLWALRATRWFDPAGPELDLASGPGGAPSLDESRYVTAFKSRVGLRCTVELLQQRDRAFCLHRVSEDGASPEESHAFRVGALALRWRWLAFEWLFSEESWETLTGA